MKLKGTTTTTTRKTERQFSINLPKSSQQVFSQASCLMMPAKFKLCQTRKPRSRRIERIWNSTSTLKMTIEVQKNLKKRGSRDEAKRRHSFHNENLMAVVNYPNSHLGLRAQMASKMKSTQCKKKFRSSTIKACTLQIMPKTRGKSRRDSLKSNKSNLLFTWRQWWTPPGKKTS